MRYGKAWGIRLYENGYDPWALFTPANGLRPYLPRRAGGSPKIGRGRVLTPPELALPPGKTSASPRPCQSPYQAVTPLGTLRLTIPEPDTLLKLLEASYQVLNASKANLTCACWLGLDTKPHYEGIAATGEDTESNHPSQCLWQQKGGARLTLQSVAGTGLCLGTVPAADKPLCNQTIQVLPPALSYPRRMDGQRAPQGELLVSMAGH